MPRNGTSQTRIGGATRDDGRRRVGAEVEMSAAQMVSTLVVDDDQDSRGVLRIILEDAGYAVLEAADGMQAIEALRASASSLVVVLDLDLPRLDGVGVLQAVAQDAQLSGRHVFILLTAVAQKRYKAAEAVCATLSVPFMLKPFDLDALLDMVAEAADRLPSQP